jgi:ABC-2 type transport system ATP-binding protein
MEAVRTEGLVKTYGNFQAVRGLDLTVQEGSVYGFLGPNGAGKTTTIRMLMGLARPSAGKGWIGGYEVTGQRDQVARLVGYLPEDPLFYSYMTPLEFLQYSGRLFSLPEAEIKRRSAELLELAGLKEAARRRIHGFSRGMRQRLGLAQALINQPKVLLLDEPASALDPAGRREVLELIKGMEGRCTVLMSTHILSDVERVCDRVGIISQGRLVAEASKAELLERYAVPAFKLEVESSCQEALATWGRSLGELPWVTHAGIDGASAHIVVSEVEIAKRELPALALQAGLVLLRYEVARPSLEDVFLQLTGEHAV